MNEEFRTTIDGILFNVVVSVNIDTGYIEHEDIEQIAVWDGSELNCTFHPDAAQPGLQVQVLEKVWETFGICPVLEQI